MSIVRFYWTCSQGQFVGYLIYRGIVGFVEPHQQVGVPVGADALQQLGQHPGAHFGAAARTVGQFGQLYILDRKSVV